MLLNVIDFVFLLKENGINWVRYWASSSSKSGSTSKSAQEFQLAASQPEGAAM